MISTLNKHFADDIERMLRTVAKSPVRIALSIILSAFLIGGTLFSIFEDNASWIDGLYWATVVMPTVGFGDFSPQTIGGRWVYEYVVASGWIGTLILGGAFAGAIAQYRIQNHLGTEELDDDFDHCIAQLESLKARYVQKHMSLDGKDN